MPTIARANLEVRAGSVGLDADLRKMGGSVQAFGTGTTATMGRATAATSSLGAEAAKTGKALKLAGRATHDLSSIGTMFQSGQVSAEGMTHAVMGTVRSIQLAARAGEGFKGMVMGIGLGLAIPVVSALLGDAFGSGDMEKTKDPLDEGVGRIISRSAGGREVTAGHFGGAEIKGKGDIFDRIAGVFGVTAPRAPELAVNKFTVDAIKGSLALEKMNESINDTALAAGRSAHDMAILAAERSVVTERRAAADARALGDGGEARVHDDAARAAARAAIGGYGARIRGEGTARALALESSRTAARDAAATMGMSALAAADYKDSLHATTREVDGLTTATTASISPLEAYWAEITRIRVAERLSGAMPGERAAALMELRRAETLTAEASAERLRAAGLAETRRVRPGGAVIDDLERIGELFRLGATSAETFGRGVAIALDRPILPADALATRLDHIITARRLADAPRFELPMSRREGPRPVGDFEDIPGRGMRLRADAPDRSMPDPDSLAERWILGPLRAAIASRPIPIPIDAAAIRRDFEHAVEGLTGDVRTPLERLGRRLADLTAGSATAAIKASILGIAFDATAFDRARVGALMTAVSSVGSLDMPAGVAALNEGSIEAARAVAAASRAGPIDPVERTVAALERLREIEATAARDTRAIREALERGGFGAFPAF